MERPQRGGKLFKKSDSILNKIEVTEFNFHELVNGDQVYTDNPFGSIIHTRLHDDEEIHAVDSKVVKFNEELIDRKYRQAVIMPRNFTDEWINDSLRKKKRSRALEDEDEDSELAADILNELGIVDESQTAQESDADSAEMPPDLNLYNQETSHERDPSAQQAPLERLSEEPSSDAIKIVGDAIEKFARDFQADDESVPKKIADQDSITPDANEFQPLSPVSGSTKNPISKEDLKVQQQAYLDELAAEARSQGYTDGFHEGEEKGLLQVKHISDEALTTINKIAAELENLKKEILLSATDNYFEICQALALAIFEKELNINPKQMYHLIKRAIDQAIKSDSFTIKVNTEIFNSLSEQDDPGIVGHLVKDANLGQGEFKIETENTTIHGDLKQIISEMLQKMDLGLFETNTTEQQAG